MKQIQEVLWNRKRIGKVMWKMKKGVVALSLSIFLANRTRFSKEEFEVRMGFATP